jgi:uncharacterized membrane protein YfcA
MLIALLVPLTLAVLLFSFILVRAAIRQRSVPTVESIVVGIVVNFFDALGIGSFAPTATWLKFRRLVPDNLIPQTMLVGLTPPSIVEAVIFLVLLGGMVSAPLLVGCIFAVLMGGLVGVPLVTRARVWVVQFVVGMALVVAAVAYAMTNLHLFPGGGTASSLPLSLMIVAIIANFIIGILLNFGVGNFAPSLVMFGLMGLDPRYAFPIMAGAAALTGSAASTRHLQIGKIDLRIVLGLAIGGIPAVVVAALIVKSMPINPLRWLVCVVVLYAAAVMFRAAILGRREHDAEPATAALAEGS